MFRAFISFVLLAAAGAAFAAQSGEVSAARPAEYMIYQYPRNSLVIKIDAPEVQFESMVYGPENALLKSSGIPFGRIGPLYQFIGAVDIPRQLMIKVTPARGIDRSAISMELIQLPEREYNSAALAQAYKLLSYGSELVHSNDSTTWAMKTYTLRNAASAFASLGWEEMRLWSEAQAAHLILYKLNDHLMAMEMAVEIQEAARKAGLERIELAALILEGDALMGAGESSEGAVARARFEQIHAVLDRVVILTQGLGLQSEQARALFKDGLAYQQQDQTDAAIRQFQRALDVSLSADNPELVNEIRATAAAAYETQGSTASAIELLEDIGSDLAGEQGLEVTENLFERGRILNENFRFPEAVTELAQALELKRSSPGGSGSWGPVGLALAWSYYSLGELDQAASLILESVPRTPQSGNAGVLGQAYGSLANIYRARQDFGQAALYREKQGALAGSGQQRAEFVFESAIDAWHQDGPGSAAARDLLIQARQEAAAKSDAVAQQRAGLYLCLLNSEQKGRSPCAASEISQLHEALRKSGLPALALDADFVTAKILHREDREREALALMDGLITDVLNLRRALPGVLGSWYWQTKTEIFEEYLAITLNQSRAGSNQPVDGKSVLLALTRIRRIESDPESLAASAGNDELRSLLARRATATGDEAKALAVQANQVLQGIPSSPDSAAGSLTSPALDRVLARLAKEEVLLTYYLGRSEDYVLIGTREGVSVVKLSGSSPATARLVALRDKMQGGSGDALPDLERMGRYLLGPIGGRLPKKIYLLAAGALSGFPFDALRLNGAFLAENLTVFNLANLSAATEFHNLPVTDFQEKVFLAGNPQSSQELFSYEVRVSPEISAVADRFVGPGLQIIQGVALTADEFSDARLTGAGLIHLAMPGIIDLSNPDRSRLLMSRTGEESAAESLSPADIRKLGFAAELAFLSQTSVTGASPSDFEGRLGFVSDFLDTGVNCVVASLWPVGDVESTAFVNEFYGNLQVSRDVAQAFSQVRLQRIKGGDETNFRSWAGFQLFIR